jgi:aryl-alcohol dehydrogenase-like predicted oxidoreductase
MEYRRLGHSGLHVSSICLGTMMFGDQTDEATSKRIIDKAADEGVNFIDTADVYGKGASEEVVGRSLAGKRDAWVLATKVANSMGDDPNRGGLGRKWIMRACEESLTRLGTDYIDIYYLHKEDLGTPLEETVSAIGDLMKSGKVRHFGLSNHRSWRVAEVARICDSMGVDRPIVSQPYYNALNRMPEVEHLPACDHYGMGVVPYSPLARGVLTGKYGPADLQAPKEGTRASRSDPRMMQTEWRIESLEIAEKLKAHCDAKGAKLSHFAVGWVCNNALITCPIAGPRTEEQWDDYMAALDYEFTAEDEALLNDLVTIGHPSTPGYNDPAYAIEGRVALTDFD